MAVQIGAVGVSLILEIDKISTNGDYDVSSASTKQIILKDPSGNKETKTAQYFTDGTDGIIYYDTEAGDIDEAGEWYYQGYIVKGSAIFYTPEVMFPVRANL